MHLNMSPDPFAMYLKEIEDTAATDEKQRKFSNSFHYRFGLEITDDKQATEVAFRRFDREIDLVMMMEYFDESLVLLSKTLCWEFEDLVYHPCKVHSEYQPPTTDEMRNIITKVSHADIGLYNNFNKTFWQKVKNYNGDFEADLAEFRSVQDGANEKCTRYSGAEYCLNLRAEPYVLANIVYKEQMKWMC